tara:strand:+ start:2757 stop:3581 length:825 start_codon:yes stop_codon:yes gene_type:complete
MTAIDETEECNICKAYGYTGAGSCQWTRLRWRGYFHHPDNWDDYHDLLMPVYDTGNTRMIANFVNLGFDIQTVGMAYEYVKNTYYGLGWSTEDFHTCFDALRGILEDTRIQCLYMMQESPALKTHYCDLARMQQSSNHINRAASRLGWDCETVVDFLNDFVRLVIDHTQVHFPDSYISRTIPRTSDNYAYYESLIATLPEEERKHCRLFRSNRKYSWRLLSIDLPAFMWQTVKMRCAEKRMDDEYAKMSHTGSWDDYFDLKVKEDPNPRTLRFS